MSSDGYALIAAVEHSSVFGPGSVANKIYLTLSKESSGRLGGRALNEALEGIKTVPVNPGSDSNGCTPAACNSQSRVHFRALLLYLYVRCKLICTVRLHTRV